VTGGDGSDEKTMNGQSLPIAGSVSLTGGNGPCGVDLKLGAGVSDTVTGGDVGLVAGDRLLADGGRVLISGGISRSNVKQ
jgi:hypothetical protein